MGSIYNVCYGEVGGIFNVVGGKGVFILLRGVFTMSWGVGSIFNVIGGREYF